MAERCDVTLTEWLSRKLSLLPTEDDSVTDHREDTEYGQPGEDPRSQIEPDTLTSTGELSDMGSLLPTMIGRPQTKQRDEDIKSGLYQLPVEDRTSGEMASDDDHLPQSTAEGDSGSREIDTSGAEAPIEMNYTRRDQMLVPSTTELEMDPELKNIPESPTNCNKDVTGMDIILSQHEEMVEGVVTRQTEVDQTSPNSKGKKITRRHSIWQRLQNIVKTKPKNKTLSTADQHPAITSDARRLEACNRRQSDPGYEHSFGGTHATNPEQALMRSRLRLDIRNNANQEKAPSSGVSPEQSRPQISPTYLDPLLVTPDSSQTRPAKTLSTTTSRWKKLRGNVRDTTTSASSDEVTTRNAKSNEQMAQGEAVPYDDSELASSAISDSDNNTLGQRHKRHHHIWDDINANPVQNLSLSTRGRSQSISTLSIPSLLLSDTLRSGTAPKQEKSRNLLTRLLYKQSRVPSGGHQRSNSDPPDTVDNPSGKNGEGKIRQETKGKLELNEDMDTTLVTDVADLDGRNKAVVGWQKDEPVKANATLEKTWQRLAMCDFEHDTKDLILTKRRASVATSIYSVTASRKIRKSSLGTMSWYLTEEGRPPGAELYDDKVSTSY
ncbi:hypothetical protein LSH36_118g02012 [Paralvinella palmiformis]|uniref:Uncharacterized protein n=1 Tax=Paralvinella palmiformis TaxID=53620 RepID=A0AAD9JYB7_9ANNE|nr:hypothetical protein LSH36_118g02012 [Paralvinella palmiformis]